MPLTEQQQQQIQAQRAKNQQIIRQEADQFFANMAVDFHMDLNQLNRERAELLRHFFPELAPTRSVRSYITATQSAFIDEVPEEEALLMPPTPNREAYWNDIHLEPADENELVCAGCRYRMAEDMTVCGQFLRKLGHVLYGGPCPAFWPKK